MFTSLVWLISNWFNSSFILHLIGTNQKLLRYLCQAGTSSSKQAATSLKQTFDVWLLLLRSTEDDARGRPGPAAGWGAGDGGDVGTKVVVLSPPGPAPHPPPHPTQEGPQSPRHSGRRPPDAPHRHQQNAFTWEPRCWRLHQVSKAVAETGLNWFTTQIKRVGVVSTRNKLV